MKTFTLTEIKDFCKAHYKEYMGEATLAILFDFIDQGHVIKTSFLTLVKDVVDEDSLALGGVWKYAGSDMLNQDMYVFKFKRIA